MKRSTWSCRNSKGGTLRDRLRYEVSDYRDSVLWMTQVLIALYRLGEYESLVHRDIKPENILFDGSGDAHITDLGIAKDVRDRARIAQPRDATDPSQKGTRFLWDRAICGAGAIPWRHGR